MAQVVGLAAVIASGVAVPAAAGAQPAAPAVSGSSSAQDEPPPPPPSNPSPGRCGIWIEFVQVTPGPGMPYLPNSTVYFRNCVFSPQKTKYMVTADETTGRATEVETPCVEPQQVVAIAFHDTSRGFQPGEFQRWHVAPNTSPCGPQDPPPPNPPGEPPAPPTPPGPVTVTASGKVMSSEYSATRRTAVPLANAKAVLEFLPGTSTDGQYVPLRKGPGNTGEVNEFYLNGDGSFQVDFLYPNQYALPDGTQWLGCAFPEDGAEHAMAHACDADHIRLRVYGETRNDKITVLTGGAWGDEVAVIANVPLGRYYEHQGEEHFSLRNDSAAFASIVRTYQFAERGPDGIRVVLGDDMSGFSYDAEKREARMEHDSTVQAPLVEYLTAVHILAGLQGDKFAGLGNCGNWTFTEASPSAECAFLKGAAYVVAGLTPHNGHRHESAPRFQYPSPFNFLRGQRELDLEECYQLNDEGIKAPCSSSANTEGNVAAALWDLFDDTPQETFNVNGFVDRRYNDTRLLLQSVERHKTTTMAEFMGSWSEIVAHEDLDMEVLFANRQLYSGLASWAADREGQTWKHRSCEDCHGSDTYDYNRDPEDFAFPSAAWDISAAVREDREYDIWVRLDPGTGRDARARYHYTGPMDDPFVEFDQNVTHSGWYKLTTSPVRMSGDRPARVVLKSSSPFDPKPLTADAVIIVPR